MLKYNNIYFEEHNNLNKLDETFDILWSFDALFDISNIPNKCKIIFGPQIGVFNNINNPFFLKDYDKNRVFFSTLSKWNEEIYK